MRRRALLHASALSAALGSAGCLGLGTDAVAGEVVGSSGVATLHAVDDPYVRGGIGDGAEGNYYGDLFTETPAEAPFLSGDEDGGANDDRPGFVGWVEDADYDAEFLLLLEARVPGDEPFGLRWGTGSDARWTGWHEIALPFERYDWGSSNPNWLGWRNSSARRCGPTRRPPTTRR